MKKWKFITNHGAVFILVSQGKRITAREIAARLEITERTVLSIITDLVDEGYLIKKREGRENTYQVNTSKSMRHKLLQEVQVRDLLDLLGAEAPVE